jgi:hypothetical protein
MMNIDIQQAGKPAPSIRYNQDFVVADPHVVYYDAVMHSPWNHDGGGHLPERDDWATYRYTVKDIILGIATHRFNKNTRRLEIRAYFVGEHPIFKELEPTKALMIVFCCQSYQSGGSMELFFEHGIPFDVRELIERELGIVLSGHTQLLKEDITRKLFAALSSFPVEMQKHIEAQGVPIELVCYNTYRGTWAPNHIKSLLQRGVPLTWLFRQRPDPLRSPVIYANLINHLRATLLEEYAVRRLEDRQLGESLGRRIARVDKENRVYYESEETLKVVDDDGSCVEIPQKARFCLFSLIPRSVRSLYYSIEGDLARIRELMPVGTPIFVVPMDYIYLPLSLRSEYRNGILRSGAQLLVVGLTIAQLLSEVELNLAVIAAQIDPDEVDIINVDRYPD